MKLTNDWKYYYKIDSLQKQIPSNMLYSPKMNPSGDVLCIHYCLDNAYRNYDNYVSEEVIDFFFKRELKFLLEFQNFEFTPKIIDYSESDRLIFIEWNTETLSQIVNDSSRSLDKECINWKEQLFDIINTLDSQGYFKLALYPNCFFIKDGKIKTIDYYSIISKSERYLDRNLIESIIGKEGAYRFDESTYNGKIDFKKFLDITVTKHLPRYWPENPFPLFYSKINND